MPAPADTADASPPVLSGVNEVLLCGRLAAAPAERTLPSGASVSTFRLVVPRGQEPGAAACASGERVSSEQPVPATSRRRPTVDTLDCAAWSAPLRLTLAGVEPGSVLEVRGALRRRFFRGPGGTSSRYEVEVSALRLP